MQLGASSVQRCLRRSVDEAGAGPLRGRTLRADSCTGLLSESALGSPYGVKDPCGEEEGSSPLSGDVAASATLYRNSLAGSVAAVTGFGAEELAVAAVSSLRLGICLDDACSVPAAVDTTRAARQPAAGGPDGGGGGGATALAGTPILTHRGADGVARPVPLDDTRLLSLGRAVLASPTWFASPRSGLGRDLDAAVVLRQGHPGAPAVQGGGAPAPGRRVRGWRLGGPPPGAPVGDGGGGGGGGDSSCVDPTWAKAVGMAMAFDPGSIGLPGCSSWLRCGDYNAPFPAWPADTSFSTSRLLGAGPRGRLAPSRRGLGAPAPVGAPPQGGAGAPHLRAATVDQRAPFDPWGDPPRRRWPAAQVTWAVVPPAGVVVNASALAPPPWPAGPINFTAASLSTAGPPLAGGADAHGAAREINPASAAEARLAAALPQRLARLPSLPHTGGSGSGGQAWSVALAVALRAVPAIHLAAAERLETLSAEFDNTLAWPTLGKPPPEVSVGDMLLTSVVVLPEVGALLGLVITTPVASSGRHLIVFHIVYAAGLLSLVAVWALVVVEGHRAHWVGTHLAWTVHAVLPDAVDAAGGGGPTNRLAGTVLVVERRLLVARAAGHRLSTVRAIALALTLLYALVATPAVVVFTLRYGLGRWRRFRSGRKERRRPPQGREHAPWEAGGGDGDAVASANGGAKGADTAADA